MATQTVVPYFPVTICPPGPDNVRLDPWQFGKRPRAVSKETQIAFSDFGYMHVTRRGQLRNGAKAPAWASNPDQVRKVLMQAGWQHILHRGLVPEDLTFEELRKLVNDWDRRQFAKDTSHLPEKYQDIVGRSRFVFGRKGYDWFNVQAAILYRSYNLGYESVRFAELFVNPPHVRVILWRLNEVARQLGFDGNVKRRFHVPPKSKLPPADELIKLFEADGWEAVAEKCGLSKGRIGTGYRTAKRLTNPNWRKRRTRIAKPRKERPVSTYSRTGPKGSTFRDPENVKALVTMKQHDSTYQQIADHFKCPKATVIAAYTRYRVKQKKWLSAA